MADKISGYSGSVDLSRTGSHPVKELRRELGGVTRTDKVGNADDVRLTESARLLQTLEARLSELPDIDQQRVTALKAQIDAGTYTVDIQRVTERLIALERDLDTE